ncbi:MAG TPA: response regulator [Acidobacteriota bacterium]|nr:response regulator [Acidobacteriota bacterium]
MAHILLVDDDQDLIEMNKTMLAQRGHTVSVAYSAVEAREVVRAHPPDAAVLDVMMEDMTVGFELARRIHEQFPALPLIMLTGIRKEMRLGFSFEPDETWLPVTKFLEKPVNPRILADEVEKLLAAKQPA